MNQTPIKTRSFWIEKIQKEWRRPILWLSGVRRVGKTVLCQSIEGVEYFDCELPATRRMMADPESFLKSHRRRRIILDEIHRLGNPSEFLKIAADHYPDVRIIATGSSTLGASMRFRDTLAGRKTDLWLTPMTSFDLEDFENTDLKHRFLNGGLPPFFIEEKLPEKWFQEWIDAYWAKDIQELFRLERRYSFQRFVELLMAKSGGIFEAARFASPCEVSRPTITNYLSVLESTFIVHVVRPFSSHKPTEIVSAARVYGFDTGFVCYFRGWHELRQDDLGPLWEHYVLNEMHARFQSRRINYWRDKRGHEVDFVIAGRKRKPVAIECKWSAENFDPSGMQAFRKIYRDGDNFLVANDIGKAYRRSYGSLEVRFVNLKELIDSLSSGGSIPP
ncbi:MAG: ATP-binding protein [Deltaproteobacteria bacterium]|nr:ATP-binding protein [Deltaproteobacteria bacterium]